MNRSRPTLRSNLTGLKFGWLTALRDAGPDKHGQRLWECRCDCGNNYTTVSSHLKSGHTTHCGCMLKAIKSKAIRTHGMARTLIYNSWHTMIARCYNSKNSNFPNYGGRGIKVCEFIRATPANLELLIGPRIGIEQTLERVANSLNYSCGECSECLANGWTKNVKWATRAEQLRNTRRTIMVTHNCKTQCLFDWSKELGIHHNTLSYRYHKHGKLMI